MPSSASRSSFDSAAASSTSRPSASSVSIDVAACEIEQPRPWNLMSAILPSTIFRSIASWSPQSGLTPSADTSASSIVPWFRGFL